jgi:hypothetical protein
LGHDEGDSAGNGGAQAVRGSVAGPHRIDHLSDERFGLEVQGAAHFAHGRQVTGNFGAEADDFEPPGKNHGTVDVRKLRHEVTHLEKAFIELGQA